MPFIFNHHQNSRMKRKIRDLDGTPPKEIYRSIIADYDFKLGIVNLLTIQLIFGVEEKRKITLSLNFILIYNKEK